MIRPKAACALVAMMAGPMGCSRESGLEPPEIIFGQQECEVCRMIITDERFACAAILELGGRHQSLCFDDLGCLIRHNEESAEDSRIVRRFVKDVRTMQWLDATTAAFVRGDIKTPMGYGVAAVATHADAMSFQQELGSGGEIVSWSDLVRDTETPEPTSQ
jgi:copper chaperone NosL